MTIEFDQAMELLAHKFEEYDGGDHLTDAQNIVAAAREVLRVYDEQVAVDSVRPDITTTRGENPQSWEQAGLKACIEIPIPDYVADEERQQAVDLLRVTLSHKHPLHIAPPHVASAQIPEPGVIDVRLIFDDESRSIDTVPMPYQSMLLHYLRPEMGRLISITLRLDMRHNAWCFGEAMYQTWGGSDR